jgi:hypothetical protein
MSTTRLAIALAYIVFVIGCTQSSEHSDPSLVQPMIETRHSHYHVHGTGIDHGHTHDDFAAGGHAHDHEHP